MQIVWSVDALNDLDGIITYMTAENPRAALNVITRIESAVRGLGHMATGRRGRVTGTYEKAVAKLPYIIAYAIAPCPDGTDRIVILHVIHGSRDWHDENWPR
jgi:plasmid stabilization system protein ParE